MTDRPSTSFAGRRGAAGTERQQLDLGKPRWCIRDEQTGEVTWIWCDRCGARRGAYRGYEGGQLWLLAPGQEVGDERGSKLPRTIAVVYCDCALGQHRRRAHARITGKQPVALDKFPPERLIGPTILRQALERCLDPETGEDKWGDIVLAGPFGGDPEADTAAGRDLKPESSEQDELQF